jgi:mandelamide amidase
MQLMPVHDTTACSRASEDLIDLGAREAVRHIHEGDMTAEEYAARLLEHYGEHTDLNTAISIDENRVLAQARAVDQARSRGQRLGPLAGLPFMVKDTINAIGYPTTAGTPALRGYFPKENAPIVDAMLQNGAILFAKANLHELGQGPTSSNPFFGFVRNPYDPSRIPGGSSGGNGAALAARIVPAGLGADGGGSIRIPAAFCGIAGLRPTTAGARKRYYDAGQVPPAGQNSNSTIGPMARTVSDVALLDAAIMRGGVHVLDSLRGVRIGIPRTSFFWEDLDPDVANVMDGVLAKLRDAGTRLIDIDLAHVIQLDAQYKALGSGARDDAFAEFLERNVAGVTLSELVAEIRSKDVKASRERRMKVGAAPHVSPQARAELRAMLIQQYVRVFQSTGIVAIAFPTVPIPAVLIHAGGDVPGQKIELNGKLIPSIDVIARNTYFGSRQGAPGLSIPAGLTSSGLPVGLELDALQGDDGPLLGLGTAVERVLGLLPPPPLLKNTAGISWSTSAAEA